MIVDLVALFLLFWCIVWAIQKIRKGEDLFNL